MQKGSRGAGASCDRKVRWNSIAVAGCNVTLFVVVVVRIQAVPPGSSVTNRVMTDDGRASAKHAHENKHKKEHKKGGTTASP